MTKELKKNTKKKYMFKELYEAFCNTVSENKHLEKWLKSGSSFVMDVCAKFTYRLTDGRDAEKCYDSRSRELMIIYYCPERDGFYDKNGVKKEYKEELEKLYLRDNPPCFLNLGDVKCIGCYGESFDSNSTCHLDSTCLELIVFRRPCKFDSKSLYVIRLWDLVEEDEPAKITVIRKEDGKW